MLFEKSIILRCGQSDGDFWFHSAVQDTSSGLSAQYVLHVRRPKGKTEQSQKTVDCIPTNKICILQL